MGILDVAFNAILGLLVLTVASFIFSAVVLAGVLLSDEKDVKKYRLKNRRGLKDTSDYYGGL